MKEVETIVSLKILKRYNKKENVQRSTILIGPLIRKRTHETMQPAFSKNPKSASFFSPLPAFSPQIPQPQTLHLASPLAITTLVSSSPTHTSQAEKKTENSQITMRSMQLNHIETGLNPPQNRRRPIILEVLNIRQSHF